MLSTISKSSGNLLQKLNGNNSKLKHIVAWTIMSRNRPKNGQHCKKSCHCGACNTRPTSGANLSCVQQTHRRQNQENRYNQESITNQQHQGQSMHHPQFLYHQQSLYVNQPYNDFYRNYFQATPNLPFHCFHSPPNQPNARSTSQKKKGDLSMHGIRSWETVTKNDKDGFNFTLMSYNVLAQDLLVQHPTLYSEHNQKALKWGLRWENLYEEIKTANPDILCMQEVQGSHLTQFYSLLEANGYKGIYKQRTGIRTDGCAIYYRVAVLDLVEYTSVEYNQPNISMLNRDNIAIIARFAPKKRPKDEFLISTTHLLYNPKRQDVRLAQAQVLITEIERMAFVRSANDYLPIVICGDLNSTPNSAVYEFIVRGVLKYEGLSERRLEEIAAGAKTGKQLLPAALRITDECQHADLMRIRRNNQSITRKEETILIQLANSELERKTNDDRTNEGGHLFESGTLRHKFELASVYEHFARNDAEATTFQDRWVTVDYIFFGQSKRNRLLLMERFRLPMMKQLGNLKLPNYTLGSDHISLLARFKLC